MALSLNTRTVRSQKAFLACVLVFTLFSLSSLWYGRKHYRLPFLNAKGGDKTPNPAIGYKVLPQSLNDVRNSTLGFQKLFVINLPERTDKLDGFSLVSSLTGFSFDVINGVKGEDVQNKSLPSLEGLPKDDKARNNIIGCWRAHLNFAQTIVRNKLSSALVLEDDADWDTHLKDQLESFAQGSQFVTGNPSGSKPHSPYGDDWDLLWLGHCSSTIMPNDERRFMIGNDFTVPPIDGRINFAAVPDMAQEGYDNSTRVVYQASNGVCLYSYALSYRGAQRLLRDQALLKSFAPIDIGIGHLCGSESGFKCIGVFPQLIDSHKAAGRISRDSDIGSYSAKEFRPTGYTFNIVHSARLNLDRMLVDPLAPPQRQRPNDPEIVGPPRLEPMGRIT